METRAVEKRALQFDSGSEIGIWIRVRGHTRSRKEDTAVRQWALGFAFGSALDRAHTRSRIEVTAV